MTVARPAAMFRPFGPVSLIADNAMVVTARPASVLADGFRICVSCAPVTTTVVTAIDESRFIRAPHTSNARVRRPVKTAPIRLL